MAHEDLDREFELSDRIEERMSKDPEIQRLKSVIATARMELRAKESELSAREQAIIQEEKTALGIEGLSRYEEDQELIQRGR